MEQHWMIWAVFNFLKIRLSENGVNVLYINLCSVKKWPLSLLGWANTFSVLLHRLTKKRELFFWSRIKQDPVYFNIGRIWIFLLYFKIMLSQDKLMIMIPLGQKLLEECNKILAWTMWQMSEVIWLLMCRSN